MKMIEIEAGSVDEFLSKLGEHIKRELEPDHDARNVEMGKFEDFVSKHAEDIDLSFDDYLLSCMHMAVSAGATMVLRNKASKEAIRDTLHEAVDKYFDLIMDHPLAAAIQNIRNRPNPSIYDEARGRRDDTRSNRDRQRGHDASFGEQSFADGTAANKIKD